MFLPEFVHWIRPFWFGDYICFKGCLMDKILYTNLGLLILYQSSTQSPFLLKDRKWCPCVQIIVVTNLWDARRGGLGRTTILPKFQILSDKYRDNLLKIYNYIKVRPFNKFIPSIYTQIMHPFLPNLTLLTRWVIPPVNLDENIGSEI